MTELGRKIRTGRRKKGMTQYELGQAIGISGKLAYLLEVEDGLRLDRAVIKKMSDILGLQFNDLWSDVRIGLFIRICRERGYDPIKCLHGGYSNG